MQYAAVLKGRELLLFPLLEMRYGMEKWHDLQEVTQQSGGDATLGF